MNRSIYTFLLYVLLPLTPLKLLWRARKQPEYLSHWHERYGYYLFKPIKPVIWLHSVSVGETRAAEPLIRALLDEYPNHQILLTHTTPTGRAASEQLFSDAVMRTYLPYDTPGAVKRFLNNFQPDIGIIMETELWFNLIAQCKQQAIPLLLVNARLSEKSSRGYKKLGALVNEGLHNLSAIAAQTEYDAQRLEELGAPKVNVTGNLKFDVAPPAQAEANGNQMRTAFGQDRPVFLAASTREGEEEMVLNAVENLNTQNLLTVIVPRHPQRFDAVETLLNHRKLSYLRRSALHQDSHVSPEITHILGDTMGEMFTYYGACDIAFIGGSLLPLGGQSPIEALSMGKPVLIGPHTFNFDQVTKLATAAGAAIQVQNSAELTKHIDALFARQSRQQLMSENARSFTAANQGATQHTLKLIQTLMRN
ncbi:MAG: 3-deoxy-D-manno-octulosonic acid transferase [Betaproteobacteria bacterium]|nr:3-deoxy-D-manno-octulosonic acid transferase [Betaproteobacteria bacterium]